MNDDGGKLLLGQIQFAAMILLGLPLGLLLRASQPAWLDRAAEVGTTRRTACLLVGAAVFLLSVAAAAVCHAVRALHPAFVVLLTADIALFASGFAAGAWAEGRALLGRPGGASPMVWGWIARAGLVAVPLVGVVLAAYLAASSLGVPVVALLSRRGNATTDPSSGSTPAS